jgi:hypothetical protein
MDMVYLTQSRKAANKDKELLLFESIRHSMNAVFNQRLAEVNQQP